MYREALEKWNDPSITFPNHQMLGHGEKFQWAPVQYAQHTLLLQLIGDLGLGWHSNDGCVLQFWISPEAARQADLRVGGDDPRLRLDASAGGRCHNSSLAIHRRPMYKAATYGAG